MNGNEGNNFRIKIALDFEESWGFLILPPYDDNEKSRNDERFLGINGVIFDPTGNVPESGDFLSIMDQNVESLKQVFQE